MWSKVLTGRLHELQLRYEHIKFHSAQKEYEQGVVTYKKKTYCIEGKEHPAGLKL